MSNQFDSQEILESTINNYIEKLLNQLSLDEKIKLLSGRKIFETKPIPRLKIPSLRMTDGPRGVAFVSSRRKNTAFPAPICVAATWNRELSYQFGVALGEETRAVGRHAILGPGINIDRSPLNGRTFEYLSEDPFLTKEIAIQIVKGIQSQHVAACLKHYICNNQETQRKFVSVEVNRRALEEIYQSAFKAVIQEAQPWMIMTSYNQVNGHYVHADSTLLKETLYHQWGLKGMVVSDWYATHHTTPEECLNAGLCLEMPRPKAYNPQQIKKKIINRIISENQINDAVKRTLRVMYLVGLFNDSPPILKGSRNSPNHQQLARKIAQEGIILLKNVGNILPLNINQIKKIAVIGPNANKNMNFLLYGGSSAVWPPYEVTIVKGLKEKCQNKIQITNIPVNCDCVIIVVGLNHRKGNDSEWKDRNSLELPPKQIELIKSISKINLKTIVILINGSPLGMEDWISDIPVVLEAWYPGMEGGHAVVNVLFGDVNPSGKLPLTFPQHLMDSPAHKSLRTFPGADKVYYDEGIYVGYRYFDKKNIIPLFPFGFGLSYTTFTLSNLRQNKSILTSSSSDFIEIWLDIHNYGSYSGSTVVEIYIQDRESSIDRPIRELKQFSKVFLQKDETKSISFQITQNDLMFYHPDKQKWIFESGEFHINLGFSSRDLPLTTSFSYIIN